MPFHMQPSRAPQGGWPVGTELAPGSDQTYPHGTPVTWDTGSQELDEHGGGATVNNIRGVSLDGVTSGTAHNMSGNVNLADAKDNIFVAKLTSAGTIVTADTANLNVQYGIIKVSTGLNQWWGVDEADTGNVVCEVVDLDTDRNLVFFVFLDSAIQTAGTFDT